MTSFRGGRRRGRETGSKRDWRKWASLKSSTALVQRLLDDIPSPHLFADNAKLQATHWTHVGRALKGFNFRATFPMFVRWSIGYTDEARCKSAWSGFAPSTDALFDPFNWSFARATFVKVLKRRGMKWLRSLSKMIDAKLERERAAYDGLGLKDELEEFASRLAESAWEIKVPSKAQLAATKNQINRAQLEQILRKMSTISKKAAKLRNDLAGASAFEKSANSGSEEPSREILRLSVEMEDDDNPALLRSPLGLSEECNVNIALAETKTWGKAILGALSSDSTALKSLYKSRISDLSKLTSTCEELHTSWK